MELVIFSVLLALFGASAVWATRPAPIVMSDLPRVRAGTESGRPAVR